jgi:hypothetical protein
MPAPFPPNVGSHSPWGAIDTVTPLGPDAVAVTTASHGGILVSPVGLARMPVSIQETKHSSGGWFEEDCDWALPYLALGLDEFEPDAASAAERWAAAVRTVQHWHPRHIYLVDAATARGAARHG